MLIRTEERGEGLKSKKNNQHKSALSRWALDVPMKLWLRNGNSVMSSQLPSFTEFPERVRLFSCFKVWPVSFIFVFFLCLNFIFQPAPTAIKCTGRPLGRGGNNQSHNGKNNNNNNNNNNSNTSAAADIFSRISAIIIIIIMTHHHQRRRGHSNRAPHRRHAMDQSAAADPVRKRLHLQFTCSPFSLSNSLREINWNQFQSGPFPFVSFFVSVGLFFVLLCFSFCWSRFRRFFFWFSCNRFIEIDLSLTDSRVGIANDD